MDTIDQRDGMMNEHDDATALPDFDEAPISAIDITNDFMFSYVMQDRDICTELLEYLLPDWRIRDIKYLSVDDDTKDEAPDGLKKAAPKRDKPETQKVINSTADRRSVRLDVYLDDGQTVYNIEMQTTDDTAIVQRARLYQAHIDINQLERGYKYDQLKPCFVIFICTFDPFGERLYRYSFENICCEKDGLKLNDQAYKLFFNTQGEHGEIGPKLRELLSYMNNTKAYPVDQTDSILIRKIEHAVVQAKQSDEWRREYMTDQIRQRAAELRGELRGEAHGIEIGEMRAEARIKRQSALGMIEEGLSDDVIARIIGLQSSEVAEMRKTRLN